MDLFFSSTSTCWVKGRMLKILPYYLLIITSGFHCYLFNLSIIPKDIDGDLKYNDKKRKITTKENLTANFV